MDNQVQVKEVTLKTQSKWRSKVLWTGIAALVVMAFGHFGLYDVLGISSDWLKGTIDLIFTAAGIFGIWNDASDAVNY
jgi:hypothetical protein